ncbi:MAG: ABC transporter ATP-binding protein [Candidatus ainarchaeum sp.]|nr:ABC transporter ATP-binding protein [Candidatus ainarchaeum sp.]
MAQPAVQVNELTKIIDDRIVVDRISFSVEEGELFGLLGANGSGKTTTFNMLAGLLSPSSGTVTLLGKSIKEMQKSKRPEIGFVTQEDSFYETLTVEENLKFFADMFGMPGVESDAAIRKLLKQMRLTEKADTMASRLSGGMKKRLNMACAIVHDPKIIFLDEPTVGLDPVVRKEIWALIESLHSEGKTIIITSHYMDEVERLCHRVAIMYSARLVASGTPAELKTKYKLKQMEDVFAEVAKPVS